MGKEEFRGLLENPREMSSVKTYCFDGKSDAECLLKILVSVLEA